MFKRILAFFLLTCLLGSAVLAENSAERLASLDIISQRDERLQDWDYAYHDQYFRSAGCLPSSAVNGVVALLGTPETDVPALLLELMKSLIHTDESNSVELGYLYSTAKNPRKSAVVLQELVAPVTYFHNSDSSQGALDVASYFSYYDFDDEAHPLLFRRFFPQNNWYWISEAAAYLAQHGHPDARIALIGVSLGDLVSGAPLRCSVHGHYATLYTTAGEFHEDGTVYLLDSWPRALEGDSYGDGQRYQTYYMFIEEPEKAFSQVYDATRITDTVLQISLKPDMLEALHALDSSDPDRLDLQRQFGEVIQTFGRAICVIYLP